MNNISFQGATNFTISPTAYDKVAETTRKAYTNLKKTNNCQLQGHKICALDTDPEYLTVIVRNDSNKGIFRYIPIKQNIPFGTAVFLRVSVMMYGKDCIMMILKF